MMILILECYTLFTRIFNGKISKLKIYDSLFDENEKIINAQSSDELNKMIELDEEEYIEDTFNFPF